MESRAFPTAASGQSQSRSYEEDLRLLPLPEPGDKHDPTCPPGSRYERTWDWASWKRWMRRCWVRKEWANKKEISRALRLRSQEMSNADIDWDHCDDRFDETGAIYGIYHFTAGRWYVGQTINTIYKRAQEHWWSRYREDDAFHQALGLEFNPFAFIALPLEFIPREKYVRAGLNRRAQISEFRKAATPRERY